MYSESDFKCDRYMLTNIKVCGKYQHQNGLRAIGANGKKPKAEKIFQKHKSKFVEDLENNNYLGIIDDEEVKHSNDNLEDNDNVEDNADKEEDFEEYMDKYSLEYNDEG